MINEDVVALLLVAILMSGLGSGAATLFFLITGCTKSCRISQTIFCATGATACWIFLFLDAKAFELNIGPLVSSELTGTLEIAMRFRLDQLACAALAVLFIGIAVASAILPQSICSIDHDERSLVTGSGFGLAAATFFLLSGDLYLLMVCWLLLNFAIWMIAHRQSVPASTSMCLLVGGFITDLGLVVAVFIPGVSLRMLQIPDAIRVSTFQSLYETNPAMIDVIGFGVLIALLGRTFQFPFLVGYARLSELDSRRLWLVLFIGVISPSVYLMLRYFQVWHITQTIPQLLLTLGMVSAIYFGILGVVADRHSERMLAILAMSFACFWIAAGIPSTVVMLTAVCFLFFAVVSMMTLHTNGHLHAPLRLPALIPLVPGLIAFLLLWVVIQSSRGVASSGLTGFDLAMSALLMTATASIGRRWFTVLNRSTTGVNRKEYFSEAETGNLTTGRVFSFGALLIGFFGTSLFLGNRASAIDLLSRDDLTTLVSNVAFVFLAASLAIVAGCGIAWLWERSRARSSITATSPLAGVARVVKSHCYLPAAANFVGRCVTILVGPAVRALDGDSVSKTLQRIPPILAESLRRLGEPLIFSSETLVAAAGLLVIALISATLLFN